MKREPKSICFVEIFKLATEELGIRFSFGMKEEIYGSDDVIVYFWVRIYTNAWPQAH